jgi:hypothetical protein
VTTDEIDRQARNINIGIVLGGLLFLIVHLSLYFRSDHTRFIGPTIIFGIAYLGYFITIIGTKPGYWWTSFLGYEIVIDPMIWDIDYHQQQSRIKEIQQWVRSQPGTKIFEIHSTRYQFLKKSDAVLFKLTWG